MQTGESGRTIKPKPNPSSGAKRNPNNLAEPLTSFIGRKNEILELTRQVLSKRLVTLTGPGGAGKTRLALAVARRLLHKSAFENGVWFVELAGFDTPTVLPQLVAATIGVPETPDQPLIQTLVGFLKRKKLVIILDNCEHLLAPASELARILLAECPGLHILATSREPLNLPDETIWLVPSMTLPAPHATLQFEQLAQSEAIQLFVARANQALPGFTLTESNAAAVEQICRRLDGIPLAIELAAARVKLLEVEQIANRLVDSMQLLAHGSRSVAPRHQTMRAALDWSYALLSPRERLLFQRLAVFAGEFTLDAAEFVCSDENNLASADVLDILADLLDKSLVAIAKRQSKVEARYRMLEPIRQFALQALQEAGTEQDARDRHLEYFVQLAEEAEPKLKSHEQLRWLECLDNEHDNLRSALRWSTRGEGRITAGLKLATLLHLFWQRRGHWTEGRRWLETAIAHYQAHPEYRSPDGDFQLARAIVAEGWLAVHLQDYGDASGRLERGLELAKNCGDDLTIARALGLLSFLSGYIGDNAAARQSAEASVESARRAGDAWTLAWTLHVVGRNRYGSGDRQRALAALQESEFLYRRIGDRRSLAIHINTIAIIEQNRGDTDTATSLFEEVLTIGRESGDWELQLKALFNLAGVAMIRGELEQASQLLEQVLMQARELSIKGMIMECLGRLGHVRLAQGEIETAELLLRESLTLAQGSGHQMRLLTVLAGLARIAATHGQAVRAAQVLGAIDGSLKQTGIVPDADNSVQLEQDSAAVRAVLKPEEFNGAFDAGHVLTIEQAIQEIWQTGPPRITGIQSPAPQHDVLQLYALGPARVLAGQEIVPWPYARIKELFFYLAGYSSRTKAQIGLDLWPDASPSQLRNSLGVGLHHLRRALGSPDWILFEDAEYRFNRALPYEFDVEKFEFKLAQANRLQTQAPERAIALLQAATDLYQGEYLQDLLEGEWLLLRREDLSRKFLYALFDLGNLFLNQGNHGGAAEVLTKAITQDPLFESAHRALMRCYARMGERSLALRQYQSLEQVMRDELDSPPGPDTIILFERIKRADTV